MENFNYSKTCYKSNDFKHILDPVGTVASGYNAYENLEFSEFWLPSLILPEIENVDHLENH